MALQLPRGGTGHRRTLRLHADGGLRHHAGEARLHWRLKLAPLEGTCRYATRPKN